MIDDEPRATRAFTVLHFCSSFVSFLWIVEHPVVVIVLIAFLAVALLATLECLTLPSTAPRALSPSTSFST